MSEDVSSRELNRLISQLLDGTSTDESRAQLESQLAGSAAAREFYYRAIAVHTELAWSLSESRHELRVPRSAGGIVKPAFRVIGFFSGATIPFKRPVAWAMLAASLLFAAYFVTISWNMWGREQPGRREMATHESDIPTKPAVAKISDAGGAVWAKESAAKWNEPSVSADEPLKIESGVVRLTLKQGTMLTVEAPAEWRVTGDNQARLNRGKMFVHVPPQATGFTLDTPSAHIVDLGTEFNTVVTKSGETKLQVVKGKVDLAQNTALDKPQRLKAGEAAEIGKTADGTVVVKRIPFDPKEATVKSPAKPFDRWLEASQKLRTDPSLVAYYDFQSKGSKLKNVVADKLHGEIVTSRETPPWTEGRFHGKNALAFGKDFASVNVPNDASLRTNGQWTFAVWFRVDAPLAPESYLPILVKGFPHRNYSLWLQSDGALHMSTSYADGSRVICVSAKPVQRNQWTFVVGVMDGSKMRLYLNGAEACPPQSMHEGLAMDDQPLLLGNTRELPHHPNRFIGVVDELAFYSRALSADEIAEMNRTGKPER